MNLRVTLSILYTLKDFENLQCRWLEAALNGGAWAQ